MNVNKVNSKSIKMQKILPIIAVYLVMVLLLICTNIVQPGFLTFSHMGKVLRTASFLGIVAIGQTLVIISGGIDSSVMYMVTFANVFAAQYMNGNNDRIVMSLILCVIFAVVIGVVNGAGIYYLNIPPIVMTLASGTIVYGITYLYCKGAPKGETGAMLAEIAGTEIAGMLYGTTIIWGILACLCIFVLKCTTFGRAIYAIGTNPEAARYSGINSAAVTMIVYVISALMSVLAGWLLVGYRGRGSLNAGNEYNLSSIAAVVIGGTLITGGKGGYVGTIAGVIVMTVISSLMTLVNLGEWGRQVLEGVIIIVLIVAMSEKKVKIRKKA